MKKIAIPITILMVVLLFCLTGCNTNFKFKDLALSSENVTAVTINYGLDNKETSKTEKIDKIVEELNNLDIEKCSEKIADNVFNDSVVGKVTMQVKDNKGKIGTFEMIFVETAVNGERVSLVKCDTLDGFKIKKLTKGIYKMSSLTDTNALLIKLFANCI